MTDFFHHHLRVAGELVQKSPIASMAVVWDYLIEQLSRRELFDLVESIRQIRRPEVRPEKVIYTFVTFVVNKRDRVDPKLLLQLLDDAEPWLRQYLGYNFDEDEARAGCDPSGRLLWRMFRFGDSSELYPGMEYGCAISKKKFIFVAYSQTLPTLDLRVARNPIGLVLGFSYRGFNPIVVTKVELLEERLQSAVLRLTVEER